MYKQLIKKTMSVVLCLCIMLGTCAGALAAEFAITKQPQSVTVADGEKAKVTVGATGDGLTYQWYFANAGSSSFSKASITSASYSVTMSSSRAGRRVYCVVTNANGDTLKSDTATLNMQQPVKITSQPKNASAAEGEKASATVKASGDGLTYQWYIAKKGSESFSASSVKTATYSITLSSSNDGRQAYCVVTDKYGNSEKSSVVTFSIKNELAIVTQPTSVKVKAGENATVSVKATGEGLSYQWYFAAAGSDKFSKASITTATYSVTMNSSRAGRKVYCVVTDKYGSTVQTNTVTLDMEVALAIIAQPEDSYAFDGELASVTVKAAGEGLTYTWYIAAASSSKFSKSSVTTATYSVTMNESRNGRQVYCVVADKYGNTVTTDTVSLYLKTTLKITQQPQNVVAEEGAVAKTTVVAEGEGLTYQWWFAPAGSSKFSKASITTDTYSVTMTSSRHGRQIYCEVTDKYGNSVCTETVVLEMAMPVAIEQQPQSVKKATANKATATVKAKGDDLTYQWWYAAAGSDNFVLSDADTDTYTVNSTDELTIQQVYCVVTDKDGNSLQSDAVVLCAAYKGYGYEFSGSDVTITAYIGLDTKLTVPSSICGFDVVAIGKEAFKDQKEIESVKIDKLSKIKLICEGAFSGCLKLEEVTLPDHLETIGKNAFEKCEKLVDIVLPEEIKSIGGDVFAECSADLQVGVYQGTYAQEWCESNGIAVKVMDAVAVELAITAQPQSVTVNDGETASVSVEAVGDGLTYAWYIAAKESEKFSKSSITTNTYSVTMTASRAGRRVYCVITDAYGNEVQSNTVTLDMTVAASLEIITQPTDVTVAIGETAKVTVVASGDGLTYAWYIAAKGSEKFSKSSITTNSYSVEMTASRAGRRVYCVITDAYGNEVQSNTVTMNMAVALEIVAQPADAVAAEGETVNVTVEATGEGLTYTWYLAEKGSEEFTQSPVQTNTYSVTMSASVAGCRVYCVVADANGNSVQTNTVTLNMATALEITVQPVDVYVYADEKASVFVEATGDGLTYQWWYAAAGSEEFNEASITSALYSVTMTESRAGRRVYCVVTDAYGKSVTSNTVTLSMKAALEITAQPVDVYAYEGEEVSVSVEATGDGLTYQWWHAAAGSEEFSETAVTEANYNVTMTESIAGSRVYCVITDAYGVSVTSGITTLNMATALEITVQPVDVYVYADEKASVSVEATGDGLTYQWWYAAAGSEEFNEASITSALYSVTMTESRAGRRVYCVVTDAYGKSVTSNTVTLNMAAPLVIVEQPTDGNAYAGDSAVVEVVATGDSLTYQWYVAAAGTTEFELSSITSSKYKTTMNESKDGRLVYCEITDITGNTICTDTVKLNLVDELVIVKQPETAAVAEGEKAVATVEAQGEGLTYQWWFAAAGSDSFSKGSVVTETYSVVMSSSRDGRQVYCIITDMLGTTVQTDTVSLYMIPAGYEYVVVEDEVTITAYTGTDAELVVPEQIQGYPVVAIGDRCFENMTQLTSVVLPDTVRTIGSYAFSGCTGLSDMAIPAQVTIISEGMFSNCSGLTHVSMSDQVTLIEYRAFYYCTSLSSMETVAGN